MEIIEKTNRRFSRFALPRMGYLLALCIVLGLSGGVMLDRILLMALVPSSAVSDFRLISEAWNIIERHYVDHAAAKPRTLTYGAISGMVDSLGDTGHSTFLTPEMVKQVNEFERGHYQGIGAEVQIKEGHVVIVAPIDGSPAQQAHLQPGDMILKVDDRDITGLPLSQVVARISGPPGTKVTLTILNPVTGKTRDVTLVRASIELDEITWQLLPGTQVVQLRIASFNEGVADNLKKALIEIKREMPIGLVLDLRNNPGGILNEAIATASQFLTNGNVLLEKNAKGKIKPIPVKIGAELPNLPMVVLVNGGSASAAEIVAGALQDAKRAPLVGETTFGTGTVLSEFPLSDGSALLLAIQEWLTPDGHTIWHKGITPNVTIALPPNVVPLYPEAERDMTAAQLEASKDDQLLRAINMLTQIPHQAFQWPHQP
ncbi:MAG: S41 family peptidase [Candidatus Omnitrophica bacterium]|nr:S41 family peptidase [Candidatus Omnitrophota bacterium]